MGFVGDIAGKIGNQFGFGGGVNQYNAQPINNSFQAQGIVNPFQARQADLQQQNYQPGMEQALQGAMGQGPQSAMSQQQGQYADSLRQQIAGNGPSPAQEMLRQALQANQSQAASQIGSQRGINPALAARMIGQNQAAAGQQAAGQGSLLRSQEQLNAQGLLGGALAAQRGQDISQQGIAANMYGTMGGLQQGQNVLNLQNFMGAQSLNAGVASQNAGLASHAQDINAAVAGGNQQAGMYAQGLNAGVAGQNAGFQNQNWNSLLGGMGSAAGMGGMGGGGGGAAGSIPASQWAAIAAAHGGDVPGKANEPGDAASNDTVHALLSPHEIVLPRSVTLAEDAPERARDFVRAIKGRMQKKPTGTVHAADGYPNPDAKENPSEPSFFDNFMTDAAGGAAGPQPEPYTPAPPEQPASQGPGMLARPADADMVAQKPPPQAQGKPAAGPTNATGEMAAGERQQIAGIQGEAKAAQGFAHEATQGMDSWNAARQDLNQKFQAEMQQHQVKSEALFNSLLDPKNDVNPNRFWEQKSTGGKIAAAVGMILGGMPAVENINKAIDRDIEAQKLNVGKKQNALSQYMQMGRDMQSAHLLASADMKDAAAAQLARASTAYQGTKAAADAMAQIGALRQSAFQQRQQATLTDFQIQSTALNYKFMQQVMQRMGQPGGGNNFARDMQTMGYLKNPEKFAETQVNTEEDAPTGAVDKTTGKPLTQTVTKAYRGKSSQAMEKASEALAHNRVMDTSLKELEDFQKSNPLGGVPGSEDVGKARAAVQNIRLNYEATMAGMNRQASPEVIKHMEDIVKDPSSLFKSGKTAGAMAFLRKMVNEHKQTVLDTYTLGPE